LYLLSLPREFSDFLEDEIDYSVSTRSHVFSWDLDIGTKWYGMGEWITTMPVEYSIREVHR
jgi:hypothetical protein